MFSVPKVAFFTYLGGHIGWMNKPSKGGHIGWMNEPSKSNVN